ncbi:MAG: N-acetylmuramoyl-L-alanine amidase, partial [Caldilineaceae bacterium]|nr:N-acetylmuramoyl-L-alanine amidase [Caldilineaceae bacterium]
MARPLFDSEYIFGIHEPGGEGEMLRAGRPGWIVFTEGIGHDPADQGGRDYRAYSDRDLGVITRLNNGYFPEGTIPYRQYYADFAQRCANFVANSRGCKIWIIGNEMNYAIERPQSGRSMAPGHQPQDAAPAGDVVDDVTLTVDEPATTPAPPPKKPDSWLGRLFGSLLHAVSDGMGAAELGPPRPPLPPAHDMAPSLAPPPHRTAPADDPNFRGDPARFSALHPPPAAAPSVDLEDEATPPAADGVWPSAVLRGSLEETITPELYVRCYRLCRDAIHRLPGHEDDLVLVGAVAPWNSQTIYSSNPNGDWIQYFRDILESLGPDQCDGITLHAFTRGADPSLITDEQRLAVPFQNHHAGFRTYLDFMNAVPQAMRRLPVFITETDQTEPWSNRATGWVQQAYAEINGWNEQPGNQKICALVLYRWPRTDMWYIEGKQAVIDDFRSALQRDYRWRSATPPAETPKPRKKPAQPPPPYRIEWVNDRVPGRLRAGDVVTITLELRNRGSRVWSWGGGNPFRLGYHYYRNRRRLDVPADLLLRTDVPQDVAPGESVTIQANVALPTEAGNYTIEFDLIQEGVTWFKEQGSPVLTRWLTVEPAADGAPARNGAAETLPVPLFKDVVTQLPRSGAGYARRSMDRIKYLVISHTGGKAYIGLDKIAQTHIGRGYPGIVYDYVIDPGGQIFKVTEVEDVAEPGQTWSVAGVNICLTGDFRKAPPPLTQLEATSRLCAWLARNLSLGPDAIVGLGELTRSGSPGRTFYKDVQWGENLRRQVRLHLAVLHSGAAQVMSDTQQAEFEALEQVRDDLTAQLATLKEEQGRQTSMVRHLQAELVEANQQLTTWRESPDNRPPMQNVVQRLPRDPRRYVLRRPDDVRYVVINHTGAAPGVPLTRLAEGHMPDWPGLLYDFVIDQHGSILQTQPLDEVVDTALPYLAEAVNIAFSGVFDEQTPPDIQIHAAGRLIAWLQAEFPNLTLESVRGLSEFVETTSPGRQWLEGAVWKEALIAAVRRASGHVDPSQAEEELRAALAERDRQMLVLQHNLDTVESQRRRLVDDAEDLRTQLAAKAVAPTPFVVPKPSMRN